MLSTVINNGRYIQLFVYTLQFFFLITNSVFFFLFLFLGSHFEYYTWSRDLRHTLNTANINYYQKLKTR